jgi:type I restriction enzyme R subunit
MITEDQLELACIDWFKELGWDYENGYDIAPGSDNPKRKNYQQVFIHERLLEALSKINPHIPQTILDEVATRVTRPESLILEANNRQIHRSFIEGVPVEYSKNGETKGDFVKLIDFEKMENNNFLVVNQFTISGKNGNRRPDIIVFINGLPISVLELKNPTDEEADIWKAYEQIGTYKEEIPDLFAYNLACIISDGFNARIASITSGKERYAFWRTLSNEKDRPSFELELEVMVKGFFKKEFILEFLQYFVVFVESKKQTIKLIAGYHQFHAVKTAVASTVTATQEIKDGKCGVVWHTQGSGKSLTMTCYAAKIMADKRMNNPTILVVTDRNDLDGQLFETFSGSKELLREVPQQAETRDELRQLLSRPSGGIIFTTIQKFSLMENETKFPVLTSRNNVVVISDEAHRTQYGLHAKVNKKDGKITYGYARNLRDALPSAGFIGFTGTPIAQEDKDTIAVFGKCISIFDIEQAKEDRSTVPLYYQSRLAALHFDKEAQEIDEEADEIVVASDNPNDNYANEQKVKWAALEKLVTSEPRMKQIAKDLVDHWENRLDAIDGKGIIVCISRHACVQMYNELVTLRPEWAGTTDENGRPALKDGLLRVVMTGSASDKKELRDHIYDKKCRKSLEKRCKDENDGLKLIIVRDMWLTGFDAPVLHTMYIDKPMKGHNLMQAIARVNRVFKDKPGGLVVDYIGITAELKEALKTYTQSKGKGKPTIDLYEVLSILLGKMDYIRDMLNGVDYSEFKNHKKIFKIIAACCEKILSKKDGKKNYCDVVLAMTKANALCGTLEEAVELKEEVALFQAIKVALTKRDNTSSSRADDEVDSAMRKILSKTVSSEEVVDIFQAAGLAQPDISILSDDFLDEIKKMKEKNLAVELLARLLRGELKSNYSFNIIQHKKYSDLLKIALLKYNNRAVDTNEIIKELIKMAQDFKRDQDKGKELGLTNDEKAFYDALADNESATKELGDDVLKAIANELTTELKNSVTIDWAQRESVRANIRIKIKRLLRKYKYPPDQQEEAIVLILKQAETLSEKWVS